MEELLKEILAELKHHTKIMEFIYHKKDEGQHRSHTMGKNILELQKEIKNMPGMNNPEVQSLMGKIFNVIPK